MTGLQLAHNCIPQQRYIRMAKRRLDAHHLCVRFRMDQTWKSIARAAADAPARVRIAFIQPHSERRMERFHAQRGKIVAELLNAWFVTDRRKGIWPGRMRLCGVLAALPMHFKETLGFKVIWLEIVIADGPCGRDTAVMVQDA